MPGYLVTMSVVVMCAHGGKATPTAPNPRIKLSGQPVPMSSPPFMVAGCPFVVPNPPPAPPRPAPCISATYLPPSMTVRVKSMGQPLLCQSSMTGPAITAGSPAPVPFQPIQNPGQMRVKAM